MAVHAHQYENKIPDVPLSKKQDILQNMAVIGIHLHMTEDYTTLSDQHFTKSTEHL